MVRLAPASGARGCSLTADRTNIASGTNSFRCSDRATLNGHLAVEFTGRPAIAPTFRGTPPATPQGAVIDTKVDAANGAFSATARSTGWR